MTGVSPDDSPEGEPRTGEWFALQHVKNAREELLFREPTERSATLKDLATRLGCLVGCGLVDAPTVLASLLESARETDLPETDACSLIAAGFKTGVEQLPECVLSAGEIADFVASVKSRGSAIYAGWGDPEPLESFDRPPFPVELLPDGLREYVEALSGEMSTPPDLAAMLALSAIATVTARRVEVSAPWREPVNIWVCVTLSPGERKSPVFGQVFAPIEALEFRMVEETEGARRKAWAQREAAVSRAKKQVSAAKDDDEEILVAAYEAEKEAKERAVPAKPRLIAQDVTPEVLPGLLFDQGGRIALLADEGGVFETFAGRYAHGVPNLDALLKGHDGSAPIRVDRVSREPQKVEKPAITLGQAVQPDVLQALGSNRQFKGRGLTARFLYAVPDSKVGYRPVETAEAPEHITRTYSERVVALHGIDSLRLKLDAEALAEFIAFRERIERRLRPDGDLAGIRDWANKHSGAILRIAALLHVFEFGTTASENIGVETLRRTLGLSEYLIAHARIALDALGMSPAFATARRVLAWIERKNVTRFKVRDAYKELSLTVEQIMPGLDLLEERGYIRLDPVPPGPQGGRPSRHADVSPMLLIDKTAA